MEFKINPDEDKWNSWIWDQRESRIFHSYEWKKVLEGSFGYKPFYISLCDGGQIIAGLPLFEVTSLLTGKRIVSVPFAAEAGLIGDERYNEKLIEFIKERFDLKHYDYFQIRSSRTIKEFENTFEMSTQYVDADLFLDTPLDELWNKFPVSIRTSVRKAEKNNVTLHKGNGETELEAFFRLNLLSRKRFGTPSFSKSYFRNILSEFDGATIYLAVYEERFINTMLLVPWKGCFYYFYVGADIRYRDKSGSDFLVWEMLKEAYTQNISMVNFGRMEQNNATLAFFKKKWGAQERKLYYYHYPKAGFAAQRNGLNYKLITNIFKILPLSIARVAGPAITKRMG